MGSSPESGGDMQERARALLLRLRWKTKQALTWDALGHWNAPTRRGSATLWRALVRRELFLPTAQGGTVTPLCRAVAELLAAEAEGGSE